MRVSLTILIIALMLIPAGCLKSADVISNPWLVPGEERSASSVSRSQMRAMHRLAGHYHTAGLDYEYVHALTTAVELYAGEIGITFELLNELIEGINNSQIEISIKADSLIQNGIDPDTLTRESEISPEISAYLDLQDSLEAQYDECYRILRNACWQIPHNPDLYYRTAHLQFLRAEEDGDELKYRDAAYYLKNAIATNAGASHLESYRLIAITYERLEEPELALRFWRLYEVIFEIAPEVMGPDLITPNREAMHLEALEHIEMLGGPDSSG